jgi:hypothetical protein
VVVGAVVAAALILIYRTLCERENKRRDKTGTIEAYDHAHDDDLTDVTVCGPKALTLYIILIFCL